MREGETTTSTTTTLRSSQTNPQSLANAATEKVRERETKDGSGRRDGSVLRMLLLQDAAGSFHSFERDDVTEQKRKKKKLKYRTR